jgi:hypothetical protein
MEPVPDRPRLRLIGSLDREPGSEGAQAMQKELKVQIDALPREGRWRLRDWIAASGLFLATAAIVLWQNAHLVVLWDLSYTLDSSVRFALGQTPYRDFPFVHPPLTFLIQAAVIRLSGRVYWHHVLYAAVVGGLGTVLAWRIALRSLRGRVDGAWTASVLLAAPLTVLGIYSILPLPSYDCDSAFSILVAILLLQRLSPDLRPSDEVAAGAPFEIGASSESMDLKGHDFTGCEKTPLGLPEASGHDFTGCERTPLGLAEASGHDFTGCEKTPLGLAEASGHDFSRAESAQESARALAPEARPNGVRRKMRRRLAVPKAGIKSLLLPLAAGAAAALPLFFKQNIGLPMLAVTVGVIALMIAARLIQRAAPAFSSPGIPALLAVLAGAVATLLAAALLLHRTVGLGNYIHWTIQFAVERRLPGFRDMLGIYLEPSLLWTLPCAAAGLLLLRSRLAGARWARLLALALLAAPFLFTLFSLFLSDDADDRAVNLLALWPPLLILSAALTLFYLLRGQVDRALVTAALLAAIHGTLLSQQLWGSTYAIWPLLILLAAEMIAFLATVNRPGPAPETARWSLAPVLAGVIAATLLVCGGLYTASEDRLSFIDLPDGPVVHSTLPQLKGMATPGPYLPDFEELLRFAAANIPASDGLILLPGEDPFYFATGRVPQFPVLLFDPATDPYSPAQLLELVRARSIRWLIVKRELQIKEDVTPQREATMKALLGDFKPYARLKSYDVYRR